MGLFKKNKQNRDSNDNYDDAPTGRDTSNHGPNYGPGNTGDPNDANMAGRGAGQNFSGNAGLDYRETGQGRQHHRHRDGIAASDGPLLGSASLQTHVQHKEREMNAVKAQSTELAEAERLEKEAQMHRERAVANGAHPVNRELGSSQLPPGNFFRT